MTSTVEDDELDSVLEATFLGSKERIPKSASPVAVVGESPSREDKRRAVTRQSSITGSSTKKAKHFFSSLPQVPTLQPLNADPELAAEVRSIVSEETEAPRGSREVPASSAPAFSAQESSKISFQFPGWHVDMQRNKKTSCLQIEVHKSSKLLGEDVAEPCDGLRNTPDKYSTWQETSLGDHSPMMSLPLEVLLRILARLYPKDLCATRMSCKALHELASSDALWSSHVQLLHCQVAASRRFADTGSPDSSEFMFCPRHLEYKLLEQSRRLALRFQSLRRGYEVLQEAFERWWGQLEKTVAQPGSDQLQVWSGAGRQTFSRAGRAGPAGGAAAEVPSGLKREADDVSLCADPAADVLAEGMDPDIVASEDAGEDNDAVAEGESAKLRKVVRKLTDMDWSLVYEAVTHTFQRRAEIIGHSLTSLVTDLETDSVLGGRQCAAEASRPSRLGSGLIPSQGWGSLFDRRQSPSQGAVNMADDALFLSSHGPHSRSLELAVAELRDKDHAEEVTSRGDGPLVAAVSPSAWAVVGEWEREWAMQYSAAPSARVLSSNSMTTAEPEGLLRVGSGDAAHVGNQTLGAAPRCAEEASVAASLRRACAWWQEVVRLWRVYRRWLKLVSSHCMQLQFEVMLERSRGMAGIATTPTVYNQGVICFRNSVLLSFSNRRRLQQALALLLEACRGRPHLGHLRPTAVEIQGSGAGAFEDFWNLKFQLRRLYQELDVADDKTLSPDSFTQQKFCRCFGTLQLN